MPRRKSQRSYRVNALQAEVVHGAAVDVVHDKVRPPVIEGADVMHLHQSAIMDAAHDPGLCQEATPHIAVTGPVVREHFDSHWHIQVIVMTEPHSRERSGANAPDQPIPAYGVHRYHSRPPTTACDFSRATCARLLLQDTCTEISDAPHRLQPKQTVRKPRERSFLTAATWVF